MASPRARIAGNGDWENGWKRLSSVRMGSCFGFGFALSGSTFLNQEKSVRVLLGWHRRRGARRQSRAVWR